MKIKLHYQPNPVIVKELRSRMRGWRAFAILTGFLLGTAAACYGLYRIVMATIYYNYGRSFGSPSALIGQTMFGGLALFELLLICFITPALTTGAISGEHDHQTYEMLMATPLRPRTILWGKLVSALGYIFLLIFAAIPLASVIFLFGGVAPKDMLKMLIILVATAITYGMLGLFFSALLKRTGRATVLTYAVILSTLFIPLFIYSMLTLTSQGREPSRAILYLNPLSAIASVLSLSTAFESGMFPSILGMPYILTSGAMSRVWGPQGLIVLRPLWQYTMALYGGLTLVLYLLSTQLIKPVRRWRIGWRGLLAALLVLALYGGAAWGGFRLTAARYSNAASLMGTPTPVAPWIVPSGVVAVAKEEENLKIQDQAQIYAAVVRQLVEHDSSFGENPHFPVVYIVRRIGSDDDSTEMSSELTEAILEKLSDFAASVEFVDDQLQVIAPTPPTGKVLNDGVIIILGDIGWEDETTALVDGSLHSADLVATGRTYRLQRVDGVWQVVGDTGTSWISQANQGE
ncbi:MAG: ABC transporter permease [Anaerolineae bacterium]|nr:ABC transporter permease [Anaerolineae bacterium]MDH7473905.1 ABC transporter permease [Anaerolineae bacterium]